jgi:hypothetical protein
LPVESAQEYFEHFRALEIDYTFYRFLLGENAKPTQNYHVLKSYRDYMTEKDSVVLLKFLKQTGISSIGNDNPLPIIYGFLERITYYNEENDFLVAKLQEKGKRDLTTIVGNLSGFNAGESLKLSGRWVHNKKFGEQFQVETFEVTVPATVHCHQEQ